MAFYDGGSRLEWREVETGKLPSPTAHLRASLVDNIMYVTGGRVYDPYRSLSAILSWDPSTESWRQAGNLAVARHQHAAVAIPSAIIESECLA